MARNYSAIPPRRINSRKFFMSNYRTLVLFLFPLQYRLRFPTQSVESKVKYIQTAKGNIGLFLVLKQPLIRVMACVTWRDVVKSGWEKEKRSLGNKEVFENKASSAKTSRCRWNRLYRILAAWKLGKQQKVGRRRPKYVETGTLATQANLI